MLACLLTCFLPRSLTCLFSPNKEERSKTTVKGYETAPETETICKLVKRRKEKKEKSEGMEEGAGDREGGREEKRGEGDKKEGFF